MSLHRKTCTLMALICTTGAAMGVSIWTGGATEPAWSDCANWLLDFEGDPCYPHAAVHDVLIPFTDAGYDVDLTGATIGDLILAGTVRFGAEIAQPQLTVTGTVTISGAAGGTELTIGEGARIETE